MATRTTTTITLAEVKERADVRIYMSNAARNMDLIGYTEHGFRHAELTAATAARILLDLGHSEREAELAAIAGYLHDIGNAVNRESHAEAAVMLALHVLSDMGMPPEDLIEVLCGVANHDEDTGEPFGPIAAAVIIADKSDVSRDRVRNQEPTTFDEHDRINYAAISSQLSVDAQEKVILLELVIDPKLGSVMEYFELFLERMVMSRRAAAVLGCRFSLVITGARLI
jgi:metal-dependent HD superfamily phosphatase/phosphodiesterase